MTISGELPKRQILSRRLRAGVACVVFSGGGLWLFLHMLQSALIHHFTPDKGTQVAAVAFFPTMGAIAFGLMTWSDGWRIVEFTCDESSFRFRKLRSALAETRALSEISKVQEVRGRYHDLRGYSVVFRDGTEAFLDLCLPNATVLAAWLNSIRQPALPDPRK